MLRAATCAEAMASMKRRGPRTTSPPAKTSGRVVWKRLGVGRDQPSVRHLDAVRGGQEVELGPLADREDDRVDRDRLANALVEAGAEAPLRVEDREAGDELHPLDLLRPEHRLRPEGGVDDQPLVLPFLDLHVVGGHLGTGLEAGDVDLGHSRPPGCRPGDVGRDAERLGILGLVDLGSAKRRPGDVEGDVPAPDHEDPGADRELLPQVDQLEELETVDDAGEIGPGIVELAAPLKPRAEEEGREALPPEVLEGVPGDADGGVQPQVDAQGEDRVDLSPHHLTRKAVERDAHRQHAARDGPRLEDRDLVAGPREVVGDGKAAHTCPYDRDLLGVPPPRDLHPPVRVPVVVLGACPSRSRASRRRSA